VEILRYGSGGGSGGSSMAVTQTTHGLAVGDVVRLNGTTYTKAQADTATNAEVIGIVSAVADANNFTLFIGGNISGLSGLTAGTVYYLSAATAGALTATEPSSVGQVSKPVLVAYSTSAGVFINMRGFVNPYPDDVSAADDESVVLGATEVNV
jgi:hypothetical protein